MKSFEPIPCLDTAGKAEPLLLLHGVTGSLRMWRKVVPLVSTHHRVIAPTALGHRGGTAVSIRPARIAHVVDDAEQLLDRLELDTVHCVGNSMGGWVALELARRGRAKSVCALSPAGVWDSPPAYTVHTLKTVRAQTRGARSILPLLAYSGAFRRFALRDTATHGERITRDDLLSLSDDLLSCEVLDDLLATPERLEPLTAACPVTIAWSQYDRVFPADKHVHLARERMRGARFVTLPNVGHVPMFDDPQLVADTILAVTAAVTESRTVGSDAEHGPRTSA
ncbi:MAG: hypothetical protein RL701_4745 [Pseudomonadota bacterium]|jgi:pimeloyl-ACP methyl ester carboxylesterase